MPRRAPRNAFAVDRDTSADKPVQVPEAKLPPIEDLPPLPAVTAPPPAAAVQEGTTSLEQQETGQQGRGASKPRGSGGRPSGSKPKDTPAGEAKPDTKSDTRATVPITRIPARVPGELYELALPLVKGLGMPSWGQLVSWTCADHRADVVASIVANARAEARRPRGQGVVGTAGNQVTARLYPEEMAPLEAVVKEAKGKIDHKVTRTMVVLAALEVATANAASQAS